MLRWTPGPARVALLAGLAVALLAVPAAAQLPTLNRDTEVQALTTATQDPTAIEVAPDGTVIFAERTGRVKLWRPGAAPITAGRIGVDAAANQCSDCPGKTLDEGGLHGMLLAPDFATSRQLYLYYSVPNSRGVAPQPPKWPGAGGTAAIEGLFRLSRFTLAGDTLDLGSEKVVLENPAEWNQCCHYGGDMEWLPDGTMVLSVGDDTNPHASNGYSPRDKREGREAWDADRTSQNPADRRGKILRLDPRDVDGDESILPADNPYVGDPAYDPFVYASGFRSNYRISVDPVTGTVYVGNVGPDAYPPNPQRGPSGYDEFEIVPPGGKTNHGWPRCIGDNEPYNDYDFASQQSGPPLSCAGFTAATVWYPYLPSARFPLLGAGSRTAVVGPRYTHQGQGASRLPARFDGKLILVEWARNTMFTVSVGADGRFDPLSMEQFADGLRHPIDFAVGPDGALYVAEYGTSFYNNSNSRISRVTCAGCPAPASAPGQASSLGANGASTPGVPSSLAIGLLLAGASWVLVRRRELA